jgi:hypothetical protein
MPMTRAPACAIAVGEVAGAAAEVEDPFSLAGVKELDDVFAEFEDKVIFVVVEAGVPFCIVGRCHVRFLSGPVRGRAAILIGSGGLPDAG